MKKIRSCRGVETTLSRGRIFTIFAIPLKNIVMSDSEKIKELEAIIVVLAKKIEEIRRKTIGGATMQSDENWLKDLKKEASKLNL